jgi:predicted aspartyl protease
VDTGFEGDVALPVALARQLGPVLNGISERMLADGSLYQCPYYLLSVESATGTREIEVLVLGIRPLVGTMFLYDHLLQIEMTEGGDVSAEPL